MERTSLLFGVPLLGGAIAVIDVLIVFVLRVHPQDGLAKLELAEALLEHHATVRWNLGLWPYQLVDWALFAAGSVMSLALAEQLLMIGILGVQTVGVTRFLMAHGWRTDAALGVAGPISISFFFHAGFYEFVLGCGFALLALAEHRFGRSRRVVALLVVTWFCHLLPFMMAAGLLSLEQLADRRVRPSVKASRIVALALPIIVFLAVAPRERLDGGAYEPARRIVKIALADAFLATFGTTERIIESGAAVVLVVTLAALTVPLVHVRSTATATATATGAERLHVPVLFGAVVVAVAGAFAPPSLFNGTFLWQRFGLFAWIFGLAFFGPTVRAHPGLARRIGIGGVALMAGVTAIRVPTYRQIDQELDDIASVSAYLHPGDLVAGVHGGVLHPYSQAYPTAHAESLATRAADAEYLSNIVTHTGVAIGTYPPNTSAAWGYPDNGFASLAIMPTVVITMGAISPDISRRLHDEGFEPAGTTDGGLATAWRRAERSECADDDVDQLADLGC